MRELDVVIEQIKQYVAEYEHLCRLHYTATDIQIKIDLERQMRVLRVNSLYPLRNEILDIITQMTRDAQDRAFAYAQHERQRNGKQ